MVYLGGVRQSLYAEIVLSTVLRFVIRFGNEMMLRSVGSHSLFF